MPGPHRAIRFSRPSFFFRNSLICAIAYSTAVGFPVSTAQDPESTDGQAAPGTEAADGARPSDQELSDIVPPTVIDKAPLAARKELEEILNLAISQQKEKARALIEKYPDTELAETLRRLLREYETFDRIADAELRAREAQAACVRAYWHSRCCPPPQWNYPKARLVNNTDTTVLYEQRLDGIYATTWTGPYRIGANDDFASPHPFRVRFLSTSGLQERWIVPGETYAFAGSPDAGTLELLPQTVLSSNMGALPPGAVFEGPAMPLPAAP